MVQSKKKQWVTFIAIFIANVCFAQAPYDQLITFQDGKICIEEIVSITDATKDCLYTDAVVCINQLYSKQSIKLQDKESGIIIVNGADTSKSLLHTHYNLTLLFKDGKFKYTITDIFYVPKGAAAKVVAPHPIEENEARKQNPNWKQSLYKDFANIIEHLKKNIKCTSSNW